MKKLVSLKVLSLLIVLAVMPLFAFAGGSAGGGGGGIVCNIQGQTRVLLYDIYDRAPVWKKELKLTLIKSNEPAQVQVERAINRIENEFMRELVKEALNKVISNYDWLEADQEYKAGTDFGTQEAPVVPKGCDFRPIGYYFGAGFLAIDQNLYKAMSETSKAAFFMHEALYLIFRQTSLMPGFNSTDSTEVRKVVAGLFSEEKPDFQLQKRIMNLYRLGQDSADKLIVLSEKPSSITIDMSVNSNSGDVTGTLTCGSDLRLGHSYSHEDTFSLSSKNPAASKIFSGFCQQFQFYISGMDALEVKISVNKTQREFVAEKSNVGRGMMISFVTRQPMPRLPLN